MPGEIIQKFVQMLQVSALPVAPPPPAAGTPTDKEKIEWLYAVLTILDSKADTLLSFDGLLLAAAAFMHEKISDDIWALKVLALVLILTALVAALLCLFVARVKYSFLGMIEMGTLDNAAEINELEKIADQRLKCLYWAWYLSVGAVGFFILVVLIKLYLS